MGVIYAFSLHQVPEGWVGVYYRGSRLLNETTEPGFHFKIPYFTKFAPVQVTMQTDRVENIPCGVKTGVMLYFDRIEVVNRLRRDHVLETVRNYGLDYDQPWIFQKIHHQINEICSSRSLQAIYIDEFSSLDEALMESLQADSDKFDTGIEIVTVRVTKPRIPSDILRNYERIEVERTAMLVAKQKHEVVEAEAMTEQRRRTIESETDLKMSKLENERQLALKENEQKIGDLENAMQLAKMKAQTDAETYHEVSYAEAMTKKLTPEFLQLKAIEAMANNTKTYFGNNLQGFWPVLSEIKDALGQK